MITEDYVSFETAKLLKEKGFNADISLWYSEDGEMFIEHRYDIETNWRVRQEQEVYQCPTLQMAMKWLREVYGIYPDIAVEEIDDNTIFFRVDGIYLKQKKMWDKYNNLFKTYEEACETAIKYCLENLI